MREVIVTYYLSILLSYCCHIIINNLKFFSILAGSLALLMHFGNSEFPKRSHNRYVLNESDSIYGLAPVGGIPREIMDARARCTSQHDNASLKSLSSFSKLD